MLDTAHISTVKNKEEKYITKGLILPFSGALFFAKNFHPLHNISVLYIEPCSNNL
jgi:hypothetical protein